MFTCISATHTNEDKELKFTLGENITASIAAYLKDCKFEKERWEKLYSFTEVHIHIYQLANRIKIRYLFTGAARVLSRAVFLPKLIWRKSGTNKEDELFLNSLCNVNESNNRSPIKFFKVKIENVEIKMQFNNGSPTTIISLEKYKKFLS